MSTLIAGTYTGAATKVASAILAGYSTPTATGATIRNALFSNGEKGVWYDPSDFSTMFQDNVGTTPVTAVGQPVGLMLDKSQGLVIGPELVTNGTFDGGISGWGGAWSVSGGVATGIAGGAALQPIPSLSIVAGTTYRISVDILQTTYLAISLGGVTSVKNTPGSFVLYVTASSTANLQLAAGGSTNSVVDNISVKALPGYHATQPTSTARPTLGRHPIVGRRNLLVGTDALATQSYTTAAVAYTLSFTGTGTVTLSGAYAGSLVGTGASNRVSLTFTSTAASLTLTVSGSVTFAQLELGSSVTNYQSAVTQFNVTEAGVNSVYYLYFDGVDDFLGTPSIDFSATDKMSVFAGVRKLRDAAGTSILSTSADSSANPGTFEVLGAAAAGINEYVGRFRDSLDAYRRIAPYIAPVTSVITAIGDLSQTTVNAQIAMRVNSVVTAGTTGGSVGTGNFGNYPLYIGMRGAMTLPFNGHLYNLIVRGALSDATQIANAEAFVNSRTGAY